MSAHTNGPWTEQAGNIFGPDGKAIMLCGKGGALAGTGSWEAYHNARLIAAAPDLLEALKRVMRYALPITGHDTADDDFARTAIAKAETS